MLIFPFLGENPTEFKINILILGDEYLSLIPNT